MQEDNSSKALWFVAGAAVGATIALLFAPAAGEVTRRRIGRSAAKGRDYVEEAGRDVIDRGKGLYEKGRRLADDAAELLERGKKMVEG
ncbi:MAG TPA: YtxH domain-containing protein [Bryobacteraceae bacterium]|nr:YtxH domain-containing protein [Bryobacteraceae bacterium]